MREDNPLLVRILKRIIARIGLQQLIILTVLLIALLSVSAGMAEVLRGIEAQPLWFMGAIGALIGWFLAGSALTVWASGAWGTLVGVMVVLIHMGSLESALWQTLIKGLNLAFQGARYLVQGLRYLSTTLATQIGILQRAASIPISPQAGPFVEMLNALLADTGVLFNRLAIWITALIQRRSLYDPIAASVAWGLLIWLMAAWAGWMIHRRHKPLLAITPLGILLASLLSYAGAKTNSLLFLMGFSLVLIALVHQHDRERKWEFFGIDFSEDISNEIIGMAAGIALVLTLSAAIIPTISVVEMVNWVERRIETWRDRQTRSDTVAESLGVEQRPQPIPQPGTFEQAATGGLPRRHLIGSGPELSEQIALVIQTGELQPMPEDALFEAPPNHYWRSLTYDTYTGRGWATSRTETIFYEADEPVQELDLSTHRLLNQRVRVLDESDRILYAAGSLITVDQPFQVAWRRGQADDVFGVTAESNTYRVQTLVSTATVETLETAGAAYPAWIADRYLALPDNIPSRVLNLARDLTATEPTPYDRATAIEQYLRNTYPYTLDVPQPPIDQDIADYFLFDLQKGYCDYYATAMVVLARAAGLPARMAVGYITGTYDALNAQYIVSEAEAHAWVEVYFPDYGWIKFEPTGGRPELWRPSDDDLPAWEPPTDLPNVPESGRGSRPLLLRYWYLVILGSVTGVGLVVLLWAAIDLLWLRMQSPHKLVLRLYRRLRRHGQRLHVALHAGDTPDEFREALTTQLTELTSNERLRAWTERAVEETNQLIDLYVRLNYTIDASGEEQRTLALQLWRRLRWPTRSTALPGS